MFSAGAFHQVVRLVTHRITTALVLIMFFTGILLVPTRTQAIGGTSVTALDLAKAIAADPSVIVDASFVALPSKGTPHAVPDKALSGFPTPGTTSYALLTTGDANLADQPPGTQPDGADLGGASVQGNSDFDVTVLKIDLQVPISANCLVGVDFRFLSQEYPTYVGTTFNDAFILELDKSTWTTSGSTISAPDNFAFDPAHNVISINATGSTSMSAANATGTTYGGATPILTAATPITPGRHSLYLSIFDQGDHVLDSAVLVDNLRFGQVANPATDCVPGARPPATAPTYTKSYYIQSVDLEQAKQLGCAIADRGANGIVVLAFGAPRNFETNKNNPPQYGTALPIVATSIDLHVADSTQDQLKDDIYGHVISFARGYANGCGDTPHTNPHMDLTIAIGSSNSYRVVFNKQGNAVHSDNKDLTEDHGRAWAQLITDVNSYLRDTMFWPRVRAVGAYDAEPAWSSYTPTLAWASGYSAAATARYYNFGSCDGCPRVENWATADKTVLEHAFQLSWGLVQAYPLPQIYHQPFPYEWFNVRRWGADQGRNMQIDVVMTECGSSGCNFDRTDPWLSHRVFPDVDPFNCLYKTGTTQFDPSSGKRIVLSPCRDFPPNQGWQALTDVLNAPCTPDGTLNAQTTDQDLPLQCKPNGTANTLPQPVEINWLTDICKQGDARCD